MQESKSVRAFWDGVMDLCRPELRDDRMKNSSVSRAKFIFSLSLEYKRSVTYKLFFEPEHGVQLKMEKIRNYLSSMNGPLQWKPKHEKL